jgi:hypothetical protein
MSAQALFAIAADRWPSPASDTIALFCGAPATKRSRRPQAPSCRRRRRWGASPAKSFYALGGAALQKNAGCGARSAKSYRSRRHRRASLAMHSRLSSLAAAPPRPAPSPAPCRRSTGRGTARGRTVEPRPRRGRLWSHRNGSQQTLPSAFSCPHFQLFYQGWPFGAVYVSCV